MPKNTKKNHKRCQEKEEKTTFTAQNTDNYGNR